MNSILTPGGRRRRRWPWIVGGLLLVAGAAVAAYFAFVQPPGDVSHPNVEFTAPKPAPKPPQKRDTGSDWPLYGYDLGRTRYLADANLRPPLHRAWTVPGSKLIEFQPVLASGRLFWQKNNGELYSVGAQSGRVRWRRRVGGISASAPAVAGGKVFAVADRNTKGGGIAGAGRARLSALDGRTGNVRWRTPLASASESSPLAHAGRIYLGSQDGTVYALDASSGRILWRYHAGGAVKTGLAWSAGRLYFGDYAGHVTCVRASNGKPIWKSGTSGRSFGRAGHFYGTPAVAFGRVYAGNTDSRVYSFAASSGKLAWSHSTGGYVYAAPAVADVPGMKPAVFIGSYSGRFMALDARSGKVIWTHNGGGTISGAASVIGDVVWYSVLSKRRTYALGARTGRVLWSLRRGAFNPAISDGQRVYLTGYSTVYAFTTARQLARDHADQRRLKRAAAKRGAKKR